MYITIDVFNFSTAVEKIGIFQTVSEAGAGAAVAVKRREGVFKWSDTAEVIDQITITNLQAGSYDTGSEIVVLGHN